MKRIDYPYLKSKGHISIISLCLFLVTQLSIYAQQNIIQDKDVGQNISNGAAMGGTVLHTKINSFVDISYQTSQDENEKEKISSQLDLSRPKYQIPGNIYIWKNNKDHYVLKIPERKKYKLTGTIQTDAHISFYSSKDVRIEKNNLVKFIDLSSSFSFNSDSIIFGSETNILFLDIQINGERNTGRVFLGKKYINPIKIPFILKPTTATLLKKYRNTNQRINNKKNTIEYGVSGSHNGFGVKKKYKATN